ncbi:sce7726 family protein [Serratia sp. D1N4]
MNVSDKVLESSIKSLVIRHLLHERNDKHTAKNEFIINEFSIANFSRRVDLVLASKDKIFAFEIKSEFDSLKRLSGQVIEYLEHFDKVTVVVATKHIKKALQLTPDNVAIWEVSEQKLKVVRKGRIIKITDKFKFIKMMTLNELLNVAKKMNIEIKNKKRKFVELSLFSVPTVKLRKEAIDKIKNRYKKRGSNYFERLQIKNSNLEYDRLISSKKIDRTDKGMSDIDCFINALEDLQCR